MFKNGYSANYPKWSKIMKITVIKKATSTRKPQNFCPWVMDEITEKKN
jgi:hypothetical protein